MGQKKYRKLVDRQPTYKQIVNYICNRRRLIGDTNKIGDLKDYVDEDLRFKSTTKDNELFVFGTDFGNGTDTDHFHCGFTSVNLLRQVEFRFRIVKATEIN